MMSRMQRPKYLLGGSDSLHGVYSMKKLNLYIDGKMVDGVGRLQVLDSGDLLVAAVRTSDEGIYQCTRANEAGMLQAAAHLVVLGMLYSSKEAYEQRISH